MAKKKGVCHNYDNCDLAENKVVQEVDEFNFVCEECGKELTEIKGGGNGPKLNWKPIAIIAAGAAVACGGGFGIWKAFSGSGAEETPVVTHSTGIASVTVGADWEVMSAPLDSIKNNDTIWIKASESITKDAQDAGVTPAITLKDSTSTFTISPENVTDIASVQVKTVDGMGHASYIIALKKKTFEEEPEQTPPGVGGPQVDPQPVDPPPVDPRPNAKLYKVSYATFDGSTLTFKKAHVIPGTSQMAQPGDKVTGVWKDNEVNSVRWYHADGSPSEPLSHD